MAVLAAQGIEMELPAGWDGRIRRREVVAAQDRVGPAAAAPLAPPAIAHAASFSLPPGAGDFGGGAVELMRPADLFVALVEFDPDSIGTALFRREGMPRSLRAEAFGPDALQRTIAGQGGTQVFFTEAGRPFCLYVVLGSFARRGRSLPVLNGLLQGITIR